MIGTTCPVRPNVEIPDDTMHMTKMISNSANVNGLMNRTNRKNGLMRMTKNTSMMCGKSATWLPVGNISCRFSSTTVRMANSAEKMIPSIRERIVMFSLSLRIIISVRVSCVGR